MATDSDLDAAVRRVLGELLAEGAPYTGLPLVNPSTSLLPDSIVDAIRAPLEDGITDLDEAVGTLTPAVADLEELTTSGRLSEAQQLATIVSVTGENFAPLVPRNPALGGFAALALGNTRPVVASAVGESTTTPWWEPFTTWLAGKVPHRTVTRRVWSDSRQGLHYAATLSTGIGGDRYVTGTGMTVKVPDSVATSVTGDIDVRAKVMLTDWTPASLSAIAAKNGAAGQRSWWLDVTTSGHLAFTYSPDGTNIFTRTSSVAPTFTDGVAYWVRFTVDVDNGASGHDVKFYTSNDGLTWTQLGTTITTAGVISLFDSNAETQLIGRGGGGIGDTAARAYALRVFNGIDQTPVVDIDLDMLPHAGNTFTDFCGNTVTVAGTFTREGALGLAFTDGSLGGSALDYANNATRFPKQVPVAPDLGVINYGHTEGTATGATYLVPYQELIDRFLAKNPYVFMMAGIENPQTTPRTTDQINAHADRQLTIRAYMLSQGFGIVDAYNAFIDSGIPMTTLVPDGVHPASMYYTGIWAELAKSAFGPWF